MGRAPFARITMVAIDGTNVIHMELCNRVLQSIFHH